MQVELEELQPKLVVASDENEKMMTVSKNNIFLILFINFCFHLADVISFYSVVVCCGRSQSVPFGCYYS